MQPWARNEEFANEDLDEIDRNRLKLALKLVSKMRAWSDIPSVTNSINTKAGTQAKTKEFFYHAKNNENLSFKLHFSRFWFINFHLWNLKNSKEISVSKIDHQILHKRFSHVSYHFSSIWQLGFWSFLSIFYTIVFCNF